MIDINIPIVGCDWFVDGKTMKLDIEGDWLSIYDPNLYFNYNDLWSIYVGVGIMLNWYVMNMVCEVSAML